MAGGTRLSAGAATSSWWPRVCPRSGEATRCDLRRSAVRNLVDAGISQSVAMLITGHKTASMFKKYEIRDNADVREAVARLAAFHEANAPKQATVTLIAATGFVPGGVRSNA